MKYTHIHLWLAMAFFSFFTPSSLANCTWVGTNFTRPSANDPYYKYVETMIIRNEILNPNSVAEGGNMGSILLELSASISGRAGFNCNSSGVTKLEMYPGFVTSNNPGRYGAYPTRIPGLGISRMTIEGVSFPATAIQQTTGGRKSVINAEIHFIKTGPLQSIGDILTGTFAHEYRDETKQTLFEYKFQGGSTTPPITRPTCTLQPIAAVPLGTHPISRFTGVNTVTAPQDFTLDLACSGGTQGTSLSATMTLTDNTNTGNTTDALSLSTTQVSGVSVQILRNGIPLHLGPQNGPNSHYLGTISPPPGGGAFSYSIPLQARYKQTGSSVSGGGQANAEALVTINYQ